MEHTQELEIVKTAKPSVFKRFLIVLLCTALLLGGALYGAGYILFHGPSAEAGRRVIQATAEYPMAQFAWHLFLSAEEVQAALTADGGIAQYAVFPVAE